MKDNKIRKAIGQYIEENDIQDTYGDTLYLENHTYDRSIVGITEDGRLVYDYDKMVAEFMKDEKCSEEEAIEWLDYNTLRAIPYFGDRAPVIIYSKKNILERYA